MGNFLEKLFQEKRLIGFDGEKKNTIRNNLVNFVAGSVSMLESRAGIVVMRGRAWWKSAPALIIVALAVIAGAGTSLAAENALPGELLYPIKVNLNEKVRSALVSGPEQTARWEMERAGRRLEEATALAIKGGVAAKEMAEIEGRFDAHADHAAAELVQMKSRGKSDVAALLAHRFKRVLQYRAELLDSVAENNSENAVEEIRALNEKVRARVADIETIEASNDEQI